MTALTASTPPNAVAMRVHRIEVHPALGQPDPLAEAVLRQARAALGEVRAAATARVYLIQAALSAEAVQRIAGELLADPVNQRAVIGASPAPGDGRSIEVHYQPGVMDPVAQSTREAIAEMLPGLSVEEIEVRTGFRYDLAGCAAAAEAVRQFAQTALANPVIQDIHAQPFQPAEFPKAREHAASLRQVPLCGLDDAALMKMSREAHLFLSLEEMHAIQDYFRGLPPRMVAGAVGGKGREPTDIELETLAQTWSEHCVHKTLKATIHYRHAPEAAGQESAIEFRGRPGHTVNADGSVTIHNLLKSTVAAATNKLMEEDFFRQWCISVFKDNAGVVKFDDADAVCIKVETHNHPSAIEPYGGAATGIGGCIRDVMGTGLAAKPIANTDVFCVAFPEQGSRVQGSGVGVQDSGIGPTDSAQPASDDDQQNPQTSSPQPPTPSPEPRTPNPEPSLPKGVIPPKRILEQVVAGVRDYGNRMGIPTVNGAVCFHPDYLANPLVFAGCVGLIPLDKCFGKAQAGDHIIALGGRTGRDGIHGATFSSAELTDTHADEFAHAVQIGNAITQKKVLDVILQARAPGPLSRPDPIGGGTTWERVAASKPPGEGVPASPQAPLFTAITDCGAGGFSSAVGEMGKDLGAVVHLDRAPLKYQGLSYTEVWISEAQERMVLAVPQKNLAALRGLCESEDVEFCDLGEFGTADEHGQPQLVFNYHGQEVGRLSMHFLHEGIPTPVRQATWGGSPESGVQSPKSKVQSPTSGEVGAEIRQAGAVGRESPGAILLALLAHPNIASKHWIIRQYDHEVQGGAVVRPLVGPEQSGPSDAAVLRPKLDSDRGIAIGCGIQPGLGEKTSGGDSYWMTLAAIDEAVRNVVCVGAEPSPDAGGHNTLSLLKERVAVPRQGSPPGEGVRRLSVGVEKDGRPSPHPSPSEGRGGSGTPGVGGIAILDNFCWPRCEDPAHLGSLVRAAEACYDGALAYRTPFVSGKDSLSNQFTTEDGRLITIPPTLLITALGIVPDVQRCRTMDAKAAGNLLLIVGQTDSALGGSHYRQVTGDETRNQQIPHVDLAAGPAAARAVAALIAQGCVESAHDCSDGGLLVAAAEMAFAGQIGLDLNLDHLPAQRELDDLTACFAESPSRYLLEVVPARLGEVLTVLKQSGVPFGQIGIFARHDRLTVRCARHGRLMDEPLAKLQEAWLKTLDW